MTEAAWSGRTQELRKLASVDVSRRIMKSDVRSSGTEKGADMRHNGARMHRQRAG